MKLDPSVVLSDREGIPVTVDGKPLTMGQLAVAALDGMPTGVDHKTVMRGFYLSTQIQHAREHEETVDLKKDEVDLLASALQSICSRLPKSTLIYGSFMSMLEKEAD